MSQLTSRLSSIGEIKSESPFVFGVFVVLGSFVFAFSLQERVAPWLGFAGEAPVVMTAAPVEMESAPAETDVLSAEERRDVERARERPPLETGAGLDADDNHAPSEEQAAASPPPPPVEDSGVEAERLQQEPRQGVIAELLDGINGPQLAIVFCLGAALISGLVLFIALPVYLFANNAARTRRAGGLVRTTLGFFVTSAAGLLGTISLAGQVGS